MGRINVLMSDRLMQSPRLYAMFLLWLLSELFEQLPEVGDPDKPVLVFFFDEAHLLFADAPKALVDKVAQVVRLIRSKGVGVYFCTQNPDDVPADVLAQLGNRVQHALRAFTPRDAKALKQAAETFRPNPDVRHRDRDPRVRHRRGGGLAARGQGRAGDGQPHADPPAGVRASARSPTAERAETIAASPLAGRYDTAVDRESAHEILGRARRGGGEGGGDGRGDAEAGRGARGGAEAGPPLRADRVAPHAAARSRRSAPSSPAPSSSSSAPARASSWSAASSAVCFKPVIRAYGGEEPVDGKMQRAIATTWSSRNAATSATTSSSS